VGDTTIKRIVVEIDVEAVLQQVKDARKQDLPRRIHRLPVTSNAGIPLDYRGEPTILDQQVTRHLPVGSDQRGVPPSLLHLKSPYHYSILS